MPLTPPKKLFLKQTKGVYLEGSGDKGGWDHHDVPSGLGLK